MTTILEYIIKLIQDLKNFVSGRPKMEPHLDTSEHTILLYNPNIKCHPNGDDGFDDMFIIENPNPNKKLRIKVFK